MADEKKPEDQKHADAPAAPPPEPPPPAGASDDGKITLTSAQLAERLDRERRTVLKALGVEKVDDAKAAIDELKQRRDAEKSALELAQQAAQTNAAAAADATRYRATLEARAKSELETLTEEQRAAVERIAGDDPAKRLDTIDALFPTWQAQAAAAAGSAAGAAPAGAAAGASGEPVKKGANTAPAGGAPAPGTPAPPVNHLATYDELRKTNPMRAAHYLLAHQPEIQKARAART